MLSRRLQVLLDERQHARLERVAGERGVSVATVVREAIDRGLPDPHSARSEAAARLLAAEPMELPADPAELKRELAADRDRFG